MLIFSSNEEDETVDAISYEDATEFEQALLSNTDSPHILENGRDFSNNFKVSIKIISGSKIFWLIYQRQYS